MIYVTKSYLQEAADDARRWAIEASIGFEQSGTVGVAKAALLHISESIHPPECRVQNEGAVNITGCPLPTSLFAAVRLSRGSATDRILIVDYIRGLAGCVDGIGGSDAVLARFAIDGSNRSRDQVTLTPTSQNTTSSALLCDQVEADSCFGTQKITLPPLVGSLLEGWTMAAFRRHHLLLGFRSLRARVYLGQMESSFLDQAVRFIQNVRNESGSFGAFGDRLAGREAAQVLEFQLHVSMQALWTLAELQRGSIRMCREAFPPKGLLGSLAKVDLTEPAQNAPSMAS